MGRFHETGKTIMSPADSLSMDRFNQQVLVCQEKAFSLAFWLLGDEALACEVLQKVVLQVYSNWRIDEGNLVAKLLQGVIGFCRQAKPSKTCTTNELIPGWNRLEPDEKEALLLVDILGNSYKETGLILNRTDHEVALFVAHGRCKLTRSFNPASEC